MTPGYRTLLSLFLLLEGILYLLFLSLDIIHASGASTVVKYCALALCVAMCLPPCTAGRDGALTAAALAFSLLADCFLLILNRDYLLGVLLFLVVHLLHMARIRAIGGWPGWLCLLLRTGLPAALLVCLWQSGIWSPLFAAVCCYFPQLVCNVLESLTLRHRRSAWQILSGGLLLFLCCDLCVGLATLLAGQGSAPLYTACWIFYLPAQILLTLSAYSGLFYQRKEEPAL